MYDFAVALSDVFCKVTHILRSSEFGSMRIELQDYIRSLFGYPNPSCIQYTRFNIQGTPTSGREIRDLVEKGIVEGWDDPRLVTTLALKRRGILPQTIKQLAIDIGITKKPKKIDWSLIAAYNRKILDPGTRRYFFVQDPVQIKIVNPPNLKVKVLKHHPSSDLGSRQVRISDVFYLAHDDFKGLKPGDVFRLKNLYNVRYISGKKFRYIGSELIDIPKYQWVSEPLEISIKIPSPLYIDDKINKKSMQTIHGYAEKAIKNLKEGEILQFERFGFVILDNKQKLEFIFSHK
jgi:glutamyl-tRNA synthetase